jgi:predicted DNA-binding transcriptional regulator AlpA
MIEWIDADKVGRILGYKARVVREKLAKRPDFPRPMRAGHPRWRRDEIERWAESQRETIQAA